MPSASPAPEAPTGAAPRRAAWRALAFLSAGELLALSLWFSAAAVLPSIVREWELDGAASALMTISVQLGFILGTLMAALSNLPDVVSSRRIVIGGIVLAAVANAALALFAQSLASALVLRFATGFALAGAYPPAMKILATWFRSGRGLAIGILVGALSVGSAAPHLVRGATDLAWREVLLVASGLALAGAGIVWLAVDDGPHRFPAARFDLGMAAAVFRERAPRLACFGYLGHMWELYAMWAWIGAFLAASLEARGGGSYLGLNASAATFLVIAVGALGSAAGGLASDRYGRTAQTIVAMTASGLCALAIGLTFGGPPALTLVVAAVWGATVIADSAQFSTAVTELSPPAYVGTALTTQTCAGFALTMASIWMIPPAVERVGWRFAFAPLALGPLFGVLAMARLRSLPEARELAGGRR